MDQELLNVLQKGIQGLRGDVEALEKGIDLLRRRSALLERMITALREAKPWVGVIRDENGVPVSWLQ